MTTLHHHPRKTLRDAIALLLRDITRRVDAGSDLPTRWRCTATTCAICSSGLTARRIALVLEAESVGRRERADGTIRRLSGGTVRAAHFARSQRRVAPPHQISLQLERKPEPTAAGVVPTEVGKALLEAAPSPGPDRGRPWTRGQDAGGARPPTLEILPASVVRTPVGAERLELSTSGLRVRVEGSVKAPSLIQPREFHGRPWEQRHGERPCPSAQSYAPPSR